MHRFITLAALAASAGLILATTQGSAQEPSKTQVPKNQVTVYMTTDLRGDPTRQVVLQTVTFPPGGDTGRHIHHGDDYLMVQEGEILNTVAGNAPRVLKAGDSVHIDPEVVHRNQNVTDKPARTVEVFIIDKNKPRSEPAN